MSILHIGTPVNIILKRDQPSGRLTKGTISGFLTKGDHPHGIKVRLSDGQIGRVQSIADVVETSAENTQAGASTGSRPGQRQFHFQDDVRNDPQPEQEVGLMDYVKVKPAKGKKGKLGGGGQVLTAKQQYTKLQRTLEGEFPVVDSSLIATLLADDNDVEKVRIMLQKISESG